ncbi:hypothetical protein OROHE_014361 [Orobanche hederae]
MSILDKKIADYRWSASSLIECCLPALSVHVGPDNRPHSVYPAFSHGFVQYIEEQKGLVQQYAIPDPSIKDAARMFRYGLLKFCCPDIIEISTSSQMEDFKMLAHVLETKIFRTTIPNEVRHLLGCMRNFKTRYVRDSFLLENHFALLNTGDRIHLLKNFKEKEPLFDEFRYSRICRNMTSRMDKNMKDWTAIFQTNLGLGHLLEVYDYKTCRMNPNGQMEWVHRYNISEMYEKNESGIEYFRNYASHTLQTMSKFKEKFSSEDIELPLLAVFGSYLMEFQNAAYKAHVLQLSVGLGC